MSRKERERIVVLHRLKDKLITRQEAAVALGLCLRQMHRLWLRFADGGDGRIVHQSRGKVSPRRIDVAQRAKALMLYREHYLDFGPTHWAEKLEEHHGIWISHDTARRWLKAEGLLSGERRGRRSRTRRQRKACFGQMVQMDGSPHAWFEDRAPACCLMTVIDDATSRRRGFFYESETMFAAMDALSCWCKRFGVPQSLYVDRHGIYRADREPTTEEILLKEKPKTQFGRAMSELNVEMILARSPQAKGRVERSNRTLQDRLIKEMRLVGICNIQQANAWLESSEYFEKLDEKFAVAAREDADAHRPLIVDLRDVFCIKELRTVGLDGCVQWNARVLQLENPGRLKTVQVWERPDVSIEVLGDGRRLSYQQLTTADRAANRQIKKKQEREPIKNNKRHKPTARQQFKLIKIPRHPSQLRTCLKPANR